MKSENLKWKKVLKNSMCGVKVSIFSMAMVMIMFMGLGREVKAGTVVPLNAEQTYALPENQYQMVEIAVPSDGVLNISGYSTSNKGIELSLIDADNNTIQSSHETGSERLYLTSYGVQKGSKYYLKVESWVNLDSTGKYTVNFTPTAYWEKENNNSSASATNISPAKKYTGNLTNDSDVDYYKVKLTSNAKVSFTFGPEAVDGNTHPWWVDLINSKGESIRIYYDSTTKTYTNYLKKGTYYLKVSGTYSASGVNYVLSYKKKNLTISTPTISSAKAKGKHVKVSSWWTSKVTYDNYVLLNKIKIKMKSDCEGYTVKIAKKSNMNGKLLAQDIDVSKKTSLTLEKHFPVYKNYYIKIRGYVTTPFGERIYGKYSKVKKISLSSADYKKCK